ncbi:MAG: hypothetical protein ACYDEB_08725 [Dehalococcoidia bacterium]
MRRTTVVRGLVIALAIVLCAAWPTRAVTAHAAAVVADEPGTSCRRPQPAGYAAQATVVHRAALVVTFGNGTPTMRFCVEFTEASISGLELLQRSGLPLVTAGGGIGAAVCAIDGVGSTDASSYSTCFGQYPNYWVYYQYTAGAWHKSGAGASTTVVSDGAVEGWAWGSTAKPDAPGLICPDSTPTPAPLPTPTAQAPTPSPAPSPTPVPGSPTPGAGPAGLPPTTVALPAATSPAGAAAAVEQSTPISEVSGAQAAAQAPGVTPAPSATAEPVPSVSPAAPGTTASGVIIGPAEGKANAAQARTGRASLSSAGGRGLIAFLILAAVLVALAGLMFRRRRQRDG